MMNTAAPDGTPPRRFRSLPSLNHLPSEAPTRRPSDPRRGGLTLKNYKKGVSDFHALGMNPRSCAFQQSRKILKIFQVLILRNCFFYYCTHPFAPAPR